MLNYSKLFLSYRHDVSDKASQYIQGLLVKGIKKNAEDIAEVVPDAKTQNLQQFISDSKWQYTPVLQHTAQNVNELIGDENDTGLFVDESGMPKKGKMSVGVARQWLGCLEKTDNGQVGVYSALGNEMINNKNEIPLLSPRDIMEILALFLPKKEVTIETVIREMQLRHIQRERTKQSGIAKLVAITAPAGSAHRECGVG